MTIDFMRKHFSSGYEYANWYKSLPSHRNVDGYGWTRRANAGAELLLTGTEKYNGQIEEISNKIWENVPTLQRTWKLEMAGAFPSVPAFLAGEPESMFHLRADYSEHTPVRIWTCLTSSFGISEETLIKRGAALVAFAQALSSIRPVYLSPYVAGADSQYDESYRKINGSIISWDVQTSPMIVSEAAASLIDPDVNRYLGVQSMHDFNPKIGSMVWLPPGYENDEVMRERLGAGSEDILIKGVYLTDPLIVDPINWIKTQLAKYLEEES